MKTPAFILAVILTASTVQCKKDDDPITEPPVSQLTEVQISNLLFMQEEEKMARDIYLNFYEQWNDHPYSNIASSEQQHMDRLQTHIDAFGLTSDVLAEEGKFSDVNLQTMYDSLMSVGISDQVLAIMIAAEIEEIDILDLMEGIEVYFPEGEVADTYQSLMDASKKHLSAYTKYMANHLDTFYTPRHMTEEMYQQMIAEGAH